MKMEHLPTDSSLFTEMAFMEKELLRKRRARMSLTRKIETLDRLRLMAKEIPRLGRGGRVSG